MRAIIATCARGVYRPRMPGEHRVRNAVRVLLLDEQDRLLLFRSARRGWWQPPGGGVKRREDPRAAALREIAEETGLREFELGAEVWLRRHSFTWRDVHYDQRERWFLARVPAFEPDLGSLSESERVDLAEWRWWTLDELAGTTDVLVPSTLAARLRELLEYGPPDEPFDVGL
jgi:8-oxo-dGTP pyrophosphatase MutT (NUDIX family)